MAELRELLADAVEFIRINRGDVDVGGREGVAYVKGLFVVGVWRDVKSGRGDGHGLRQAQKLDVEVERLLRCQMDSVGNRF